MSILLLNFIRKLTTHIYNFISFDKERQTKAGHASKMLPDRPKNGLKIILLI